jgi:hypothetical protein
MGASLWLIVHVGGGTIVESGLTRGLLVRHGDLEQCSQLQLGGRKLENGMND